MYAHRQHFLKGLFDCQEQFYVWYEGAENKSYAKGVAAFQALRVILESAVGMLSGGADRQQTVRMLLRDIDEIVLAMQAEMTAQAQTTSGSERCKGHCATLPTNADMHAMRGLLAEMGALSWRVA